MRPTPSIILSVGVRTVFHTVLLFSLFLLLAGHNDPGGGFVGGLVAGAALVLRHLEAGSDALRRTTRLTPQALLGAGLTLAALTALIPALIGSAVLESGSATLTLPVFGTVKATSTLAFDIGVYLVVVGLVLSVLETLGPTLEERGR